MGNCQAAEAATVLIQHPGGKDQRFYWSLPASEVMATNSGHYVAVIVTVSTASHTNVGVKHLKLLRPNDVLQIGHVYRLVSFEEVLREFVSKKHVRLSRLLTAEEKRRAKIRRGGTSVGCRGNRTTDPHSGQSRIILRASLGCRGNQATNPHSGQLRRQEAEELHIPTSIRSLSRSGGLSARHGQWRPALQSIEESAGT